MEEVSKGICGSAKLLETAGDLLRWQQYPAAFLCEKAAFNLSGYKLQV